MPSGPDSIYLIDNTKEEDFSLHFETPSWSHWLLMDLTVAKRIYKRSVYSDLSTTEY